MLGHSVFNLAILIFNLFEGKQHLDQIQNLKLTPFSPPLLVVIGAKEFFNSQAVRGYLSIPEYVSRKLHGGG